MAQGTGRDSRTRFPARSDLPVDLAFLERFSQASSRQNLRGTHSGDEADSSPTQTQHRLQDNFLPPVFP